MIKIIIIDDDFLVTASLKTILEATGKVTVLATGNDGDDAVTLYRRHQPDIVLTDIQMKEKSGLKATEEIRQEFPDAKILLLTTFSDEEYIIQALKLGAKGYLLKQDYETILPALEAVASGQNVFGTEIISKIPELLLHKTSFDYSIYDNNEKEFGIIQLKAVGLSNKEIASKLCLSEGTVRNYLSTI